MKLFAVTITVCTPVEIPVAAETEEAALAYAKGTDEWKADGILSDSVLASFTATSARTITTPKESPFESDVLCWGNEDTELPCYEAFFFDELAPEREAFYASDDDDEEASQAAYDVLYKKERELAARFDTERGTS